jgi:two-component system, LytTR family, sensor kinase
MRTFKFVNMKKIENIIDQRKIRTHAAIILLSLIAIIITISLKSNLKSWNSFVDGFVLLLIQVEVFLFLARVFFKNVKSGKTPGEITRIVLTRFALFISCCFAVALIIYVVFLYAKQWMTGGQNSRILYEFFNFGFRDWVKPTMGGLLFGAGIFIFSLWQEALRNELILREENLIFQNQTLKNQINPHFLFNSLNTLSSLIYTNPDMAERFISKLSSIYRYILENSSKDKVPLQSELAFINDYFELHKIRDEEKIVLAMDVPVSARFDILPVSLQILIENSVKHNRATRIDPLTIEIYLEGQQIVVRNNLQKMATQIKSTGVGLKNLAKRVKLISGKDLNVVETNTHYVVKFPLLS